MPSLHRSDFLHLLAGPERPHEDVLDDVYKKYAHSDPFMPILHFVDHATLGPEALVALGLGDKVNGWISHHKVRPYDPPMSDIDIRKDWRLALGKPETHGDWLRFFETELNVSLFQDVLREWVPRLSHEVGAYLFHGLIRTAYVTRALGHKDTKQRRGELARGLSLWAIGIKSQPDERRSSPVSPDVQHEILKIARSGATTFLDTPTIPHLHLVTGPMAYLMIHDYLRSEDHELAIKSFKKTHATALRNFDQLSEAAEERSIPTINGATIAGLVDRFDPHPLKLTEAALRAFSMTGDELFLKTAGQAKSFLSVKGVLSTLKSVARLKTSNSMDLSL